MLAEYGAARFDVTITPRCAPVLKERGDRLIGSCTCGAAINAPRSARWLADYWLGNHTLDDPDAIPDDSDRIPQ